MTDEEGEAAHKYNRLRVTFMPPGVIVVMAKINIHLYSHRATRPNIDRNNFLFNAIVNRRTSPLLSNLI